jgi:hypothetical protein
MTQTQLQSPSAIAEAYFRTWRDRDYEAFGALLAEDARFVGSMGTADGRDACVNGVRGLRDLLQDIRVVHRFVDGDDVLTWFELVIDGIAPVPVANWSHVENGQITEIRVTFDPRSLIKRFGM